MAVVKSTKITDTAAGPSAALKKASTAGAAGNTAGKSVAAPLNSQQIKAQLAGGTKTASSASSSAAVSGSGSYGSSGYSSSYGSSGGYSSGGGSSGGGSTGGGSSAPVSAAGTPNENGWLAAAGELFANDPQAMLAVRLRDQYGETGGNGLYGMLAPYASAANAMYLASGAGGTVDDGLNYLQSYWDTLQSPGGRINSEAAINNIFNAPQASALEAYLTSGAPNKQADAALGLIRGTLTANYNPYYANAIMSKLNLERDRYIGEAARGAATGSFVDYLKASVPGYQGMFFGEG